MALKQILSYKLILFPALSLNIYRRTHKLLTTRYYSVNMLKPNTVYFQNQKGDDKLFVDFLLTNEDLSINKTLKFQRKMSETIETFLKRVDEKVNMLLDRKSKIKKKKLGKDIETPEPKSNILFNNVPMSKDIVFENIFNYKKDGELKLRVLDNDYDVVFNAPIISELQLPKEIRQDSIVYPVKFDTVCVDVNKSIFKWFKAEPKSKKWVECGDKFFYIPTKEDVGSLLKLECTPVNNILTGPTCVCNSESTVQEFNGFCEIKKRLEFTKSKTDNDEIRIVSYNILADCYTDTKEAKTTLFTYCNPKILDVDYRKCLLNVEIVGYNADLICLQEAEVKMFKTNFLPILKMIGYNGIFNVKETVREGCAMFYNTEKFKLLSSELKVYSQEIFSNELLANFKTVIEKNKTLVERLNNLSTLLQIAVFECVTQPNDLLLVGNTHLYFHPNADHIRLLQGLVAFNILLNSLKQLKEKHPNKNISLVLCGDFNSTPECGFHTFLNEGSVDSNHIDWKSKEDEFIENISQSHDLKMKNACGTSSYTNYTSLFKGCIDYIYFQTDRLEVKQIVPFPSEESLSLQEAIPSEFYPSDHVALIADLKFKSN